MNLRKHHVLMLDDPGAGGGGSATTTADPATTTTTTADPAATTTTSALIKPVPLNERIPEKFHVKKGDELDAEASWGKMAEGYKALEQRFGSGDVPPKTAEEYTVNVPEAMKADWVEDDRVKAFKTDALAAGITQKQFDFVMGKYFETAPQLIGGAIANSTDATIAALDKTWGAEYDKNINAAMKAFEAYADPADKGQFDNLARDPALAYRILAKIGPELGEARGVPNGTEGTNGDDIQALLTSPILQNSKHPEYAATRAKVDTYYAKKYGTAPVN